MGSSKWWRSAGLLRAAGGAPDADRPVGSEQRLGELHHDRENVEPGKGVHARIPERRLMTGDDVLEPHQVEEERIVANPGESGQAELARPDRDRKNTRLTSSHV